MALTKQVKYKDSSGNEQLIDIGVDAKNVESNTFSQAAARANLVSGEKLPTIFGKLMKWFADLKTVAWTGSYNDLTNKPTMSGITGTVAVTRGGTGATTASQARVNLGVGAAGTYSVANNCTTTAAGYALDARQGKALMDKANKISSDLTSKLNGCKITYESGSFYAAYGSVKKKLANPLKIKEFYGQWDNTDSVTQIKVDVRDWFSLSFGDITSYNSSNPGVIIITADGAEIIRDSATALKNRSFVVSQYSELSIRVWFAKICDIVFA